MHLIRKSNVLSEYAVVSHDTDKKDPGNEYLLDGKIYLLDVFLGKKFKIKLLNIKHRDELPFNPISITSYSNRRETLVYVLNRIVSYQYGIEVFQLKQNILFYKYRIRPEQSVIPTDIFVDDDGILFITARPNGFFSSAAQILFESRRKGLISYRDKNWTTEGRYKSAFQIEIDNSKDSIYILLKNSIDVIKNYKLKDTKENNLIQAGDNHPDRISFNDDKLSLLVSKKKRQSIVEFNTLDMNSEVVFVSETGTGGIRTLYKHSGKYFLMNSKEQKLSICE